MFLKKAIVVEVMILGLLCVGCTRDNENRPVASIEDTNKSDITSEKSVSKDENNNIEGEKVESNNEENGTVEVINEDTNEITEEDEVGVIELIPDKDFYFPDIDEVPSEVRDWVLANKDKNSDITAYVKTTATNTYVLASVKNDTGGKIAMIHNPYMMSDNSEWVVPYSYMLRDTWLDSDGNEYLIMKTNKPAEVRLEHATIYEK